MGICAIGPHYRFRPFRPSSGATTDVLLPLLSSFVAEYLLIENRQKAGFDAGMPGAGLLIYHVDEKVQENYDDWHPKVMLLQVGGAGRGVLGFRV